jgi:hypothetical protein
MAKPLDIHSKHGERFPQKKLPNARTFVNVVQHLRDFGRFEMNKRDLGRQREDRIVVAEEEEILHEIESQPRISTRRLANHLGVSHFAFSKHRSENSSKQRHSESNSVLSWARRAEACIANDGRHFEQLL